MVEIEHPIYCTRFAPHFKHFYSGVEWTLEILETLKEVRFLKKKKVNEVNNKLKILQLFMFRC